jgi:anti-sigma B factor antagonist
MYAANAFSVASSNSAPSTVTICVTGEIDMVTAPQLFDCLRLATEGKPRRLIVELSRVSFMDSSGINALVKTHKRLPGTSEIVLRGLQPNVRRVLEITAVENLFEMER